MEKYILWEIVYSSSKYWQDDETKFLNGSFIRKYKIPYTFIKKNKEPKYKCSVSVTDFIVW